MHAPLHRAWLLLVDDDETARMSIPRVLLRQAPSWLALDVVTAATPREAREALDARCDEPLLVVSDFDLKAEMHGLDLLDEVARRCPTARRILYSGHPPDVLARLLEGRDIHAFIEKPDDFRQLVGPLLMHLEAVSRPATA